MPTPFAPLVALFLLALAGCAPQVVDAVDRLDSGTESDAGDTGDADSGGPCPDGGSEMDRDGDSVPDCVDECPDDPDKIRPGVCGCSLLDPDQVDGGPSCLDLVAPLRHRYAFDGIGLTVVDSQGAEHGAVHGVELNGTGSLALRGGTSGDFVDLPNELISILPSATLEVWLTWHGGSPWQRIFDFGDDTTHEEGQRSGGASYLFLTPRTPDGDADAPLVLRAVIGRPTQPSGVQELRANATRALPSGVIAHVAVTVDTINGRFSVYIDGELEAGVDLTSDLSVINDINNWLGQSQFTADPNLSGTLHEFRIYGAALTAEQIRLSFQAGPDPAFLR